MTEYDYSPEAYERFLATQNRIAKWVDETEQHRSQFQSAVKASQHPHRLHREPSRRRPNLYIHPPPSDSSSSDSEDSLPPMPLSAPGMMYPAPAQPRYPGPPVAPPPQPLLSPPPMMQMVYPNTQRSPYYPYLPPATRHHKSASHSHTIRSPHHSPAYYSMAPSPQVSPAYPHPQQMFYPPPTGHPPAGYVILPQQHPPKLPQQQVVYLRA